MSVSSGIFRDVMGRLAAGVTVVTSTEGDGSPRGLTATAVSSVSLDPPLVLVCVGADARTGEAIARSGRFGLNFLGRGGLPVSDRFAGSEEQKFLGVDWRPGPGGSPVLPEALAWAECELEQEVVAGDHTIFIGRVTAARVERRNEDPLVHFGGRYHTVRELGE